MAAGTAAAIASFGAVLIAPGASAKGPAATVAVKVASVNVGGSKHDVLETAAGHPVYLLTGDSTSHPTCTSAICIGNWPVVSTAAKKVVLGKGVKGKLTIWKHGKYRQLVLNGHPLYTFAGDSGAGTANGQGLKSFGGVWETLTAGGSAFVATSASKNGTSSNSGSGSAGTGYSASGSADTTTSSGSGSTGTGYGASGSTDTTTTSDSGSSGYDVSGSTTTTSGSGTTTTSGSGTTTTSGSGTTTSSTW
jgi:predicted lipoprotein with Yx(FWY)xxD motif